MDEEKNLEFLKLCDSILKYLSETPDWPFITNVLSKLNISCDDKLLDRINDKLVNNGFVKTSCVSSGGYRIKINSTGTEFIELGGYIGQLKREKEKEKREKELAESTINSNKANVKFFRWNLGLGVLNLIFFIYSVLKELL